MFNRGKELLYVSENPLANIKPLPVPENKPKFLSKTEIEAILKVASPKYRDVFLFLINTGLRKSEFINLKWENVNLRNGFIYIPGEDSKSGKGRTIPLNKTAKGILLSINKKGQYVFLNKNGRQHTKSVLLKAVMRLYKNAKLDKCGYTIHTLRHTFASHLVMSGVDIATVKELLGHASLNTTMIYAHLSREHLKTAVDLLDKELFHLKKKNPA